LSSSGPLFPSAATGSTNTIGGGTSAAWSNPNNIFANDGNYTTVLPGTAVTQDLRGGSFGFSIPATAIIDGILLEVNALTPATTNVEGFNFVALEGGGGASANRASGATLTPSATTFSFGGSSDKWGTTWTPAQINSGGFVANVSFQSTGGGPGTIEVDFFRVTVFYHNVFNNTIGFVATASVSETPSNKMNATTAFSATTGLSELATLVVNSTMSFSNTTGMSDIGINIPIAPTLGFPATAGMTLTAANIMSARLPLSSTAGMADTGINSASRGIAFSSQAYVFINATVGGRPSASTDDYTSLVTSEHNKRPNFMAMIQQDVQAYVDNINLLRNFSNLFDIDQAVGQQLDMIGVWVGISRNIAVPLTGVYFAFNTALVGFNQGALLGIGNATSGLTVLGDLDYLLLLKAKIAANHWDGTIPGAYKIWGIVFANQPFTLMIQDGQDMTMAIIVVGTINTAVTLSLIINGYITLRPAGVLITGYYQNTVANFPVFGFGPESATLAGFNDGAWVKKIG